MLRENFLSASESRVPTSSKYWSSSVSISMYRSSNEVSRPLSAFGGGGATGVCLLDARFFSPPRLISMRDLSGGQTDRHVDKQTDIQHTYMAGSGC